MGGIARAVHARNDFLERIEEKARIGQQRLPAAQGLRERGALEGEKAVEIGIIDELGGLSNAMECLYSMIENSEKRYI